MRGFGDFVASPKCSSHSATEIPVADCSDAVSCDTKSYTPPLLSSLFASAFSIFESHGGSLFYHKYNNTTTISSGWAATMKRVVNGESMKRLHDRVLGSSHATVSGSDGDLWLLGICYKLSSGDLCGEIVDMNDLNAFELDFSSKILITYRKGFDAIGDSKYTTDVNWGCMIRSSQMLVAQALLFHSLGRSWRRHIMNKKLDEDYIKILHLFGDTEISHFSIHNLLKFGHRYGLVPGSWVGPYAICRTWELLTRSKQKEIERHIVPIALYVVSGDQDGQQGGAPVVCMEDVYRHCLNFTNGHLEWIPVILLVPLVLGLDKINYRYIPLLVKTFTFPQSLGILGGRPGASTYIVGVQDGKAFYLDPHEVQMAVHIDGDKPETDTSSYHSHTIRHFLLESIDPSLAIGFYCKSKDDFEEFCRRASQLAEESCGAPLFTVSRADKSPTPVARNGVPAGFTAVGEDESSDMVSPCLDLEDEWQLL